MGHDDPKTLQVSTIGHLVALGPSSRKKKPSILFNNLLEIQMPTPSLPEEPPLKNIL